MSSDQTEPEHSEPHGTSATGHGASGRSGAPLPGEGGSSTSRAGGLIAGAIAVVCLTVATVLAQPGLAATLGSTATGTTTSTAGTVASAPAVVPTGRTVTSTVHAQGMAFRPDRIRVRAGDRLRVAFVNDDTQSHDLAFSNGASLPTLSPGTRRTLDVGVVAGDLTGWCSLPGHRAMGMTLTVTATGAKAAEDAAAASSAPSSPHSPAADVRTPTAAALKAQANAADPSPAELPPLGTGTVHDVTLTVTEHTQRLASGVTRRVWTYNGSTPGPVLHGRVGDTFRVTLVNRGSMGHSIDFHAGALAPDQPMRTIAPGESLVYTFTATKAGIWMYHCSTAPMSEHIANGMFGAVVIEPADLPAVDRSYVLVQSDLYLGANGQPADPVKVAAGVPDLMAFNGRPFQYDAHPLPATAGRRVRIWVLDAGPDQSWAFHVVGTQFDTVWTEGAYRLRDGASPGMADGEAGAQELPLLAAQGGFVEFVPPEPGRYPIVNHQMSLAEKGAHGILDVTAAP
jgi:nitrite reductase (NO-forming)